MAYMVVLTVLLFFALLWAVTGIRTTRPYRRGVAERLGCYKATVNPGLRVIFSIIESLRPMDMREQVVDVPPQEVITSDNVVVSVDAFVYYEPTDPPAAHLQAHPGAAPDPRRRHRQLGRAGRLGRDAAHRPAAARSDPLGAQPQGAPPCDAAVVGRQPTASNPASGYERRGCVDLSVAAPDSFERVAT
jgi:hypothetical protein